MADWSRAYSARWRVRRVDPATWECTSEVDGITSATITRSGDEAEESGGFELSLSPVDSLDAEWVRVEAVVEQGTTVEVVEMATLLMAGGNGRYQRGMLQESASGLSVLWPAGKRKFRAGAYAPKGADGAAWVADLLGGCTPAPVTTEGGFTLSDHIVFKSGQSYLSAAWQVLDAAGWRLRVNGRGEVSVCAPATEPALEVNPSNVCDGISRDGASVDTINTYVAVDGGEVAVAVNDSPASPTSTVSIGTPVELVDTSPKRINGESLQAYAERKLMEARMQEVRTWSWTRDYSPDAIPGDLVRARVPSAGIDGVLRITSQTLTCKNGLALDETVALEEVV